MTCSVLCLCCYRGDADCAVTVAMQVFTTLALVGMLILPLNCFPWVLSGVLEAYVSLERIQRFLQLPNQDLQAYYCQGRPHLSPAGPLLPG